ncbi:reverse transcriptase domain-containing protein [Tanacetum coccineum]
MEVLCCRFVVFRLRALGGTDPSNCEGGITILEVRFQQPCHDRLKLNAPFHNRLSSDQVDELDRAVSRDEIRRAVWNCGENKSPGPDGYTFEFFRKYWSLVGADFCDAVDYFFKSVLANRLATVISDLVSETQSAFVANRQILEAYDSVRGISLGYFFMRLGLGRIGVGGWGLLLLLHASILVNRRRIDRFNRRVEDYGIYYVVSSSHGVESSDRRFPSFRRDVRDECAQRQQWDDLSSIMNSVVSRLPKIGGLVICREMESSRMFGGIHLCPLCNAAMEDVQHVFFRCDVARVVLRKICRWWDLDWQEICSFSDWDAWFLSFRLSSRLKSILEAIRCACGLEAVIRTSWTNRNLGRRFYGCPTLSPTCVNFLKWYDPPMYQRSVQIIPGLLRSRNELEEILAMVEEKRRKLEVAFLLDVLSRKWISHKGQKESKEQTKPSTGWERQSQIVAKAIVSKVSTSSSTPAVSSDVAELKDMVRALILDKKNQTPAPASVKAVEQSCVTCGGGHSYQNCPATNDYRDNIQEYVSQAAAVNYNQGNASYRPQMVANQIRPPGFPPMQNHQNNQNQGINFNQNRGNNLNQNRGNNFNQGQVYQPQINQPPTFQAPPYQAPAPAHPTPGVSKSDFDHYVKANDAVMQNMQNQMANITDLITKCNTPKNQDNAAEW